MKSRFVVSYGDIALLVDTSPRRVGTVMATRGGEVSWWRVTNRNGELPAHLLPLARKQWRREGIAHTERRCDFERHRMEPCYLAALFGDALGEFIS